MYPYNQFIHLRFPFQGASLYDDSVDALIVISILPSVTSHWAVLIMDMYLALSSSEMNSESSNSG